MFDLRWWHGKFDSDRIEELLTLYLTTQKSVRVAIFPLPHRSTKDTTTGRALFSNASARVRTQTISWDQLCGNRVPVVFGRIHNRTGDLWTACQSELDSLQTDRGLEMVRGGNERRIGIIKLCNHTVVSDIGY